jgi:hypothetical protein
LRPDIERWSGDEEPEIGYVLLQDYHAVKDVQRGIKSRGFKGPLWGEQEARVRHYHKEIDRYIVPGEPNTVSLREIKS